jgi:hypothetical protein
MILNGETPGKLDDGGNILGDEMNSLQIVIFQSDGILDDYDGIPIPFQVISSFPPIFSDIPHT